MAELEHPSIAAADESTHLDPTGRLWWDHMLDGDFRAAWQITDAHRAAGIPDPDRMWDGSPVDGRRVMLRCLHGFGDSVMLLRYAPLLRARVSSLTVEVNPHFVPLTRCFPGVDHVITWGADAPPTPVAYDVQVEINELPYLFRSTPDTIPPPPSLRLPADDLARAEAALAAVPHPRIGVVWESSEWDRARSIPLAPMLGALEPALVQTGAHLVSLQTVADEATSGWTARMQSDSRLHTANSCGPGLVALACAINQLDLVFTVDTMAAHLAATLGRPTLLLLQREPDWRWMRDRPDSPWYPKMRLLRQATLGPPASGAASAAAGSSAAWQPVLEQLAFSLAETCHHDPELLRANR